MFLDSCLICSQITWKKEVLCKECLKEISQRGLIYRHQNNLDCYSLLFYKDLAKSLILQCKQGANPSLTHKLTKLVTEMLIRNIHGKYAGVICIPNSKNIDQDHSYLMGVVVAKRLQLPLFSDILSHDGDAKSQKEKSLEERKNIKFSLKKVLPSGNSGVWIIVDDVITTGMTLSEAHKTLGSPSALCLTLATRPYNKGIHV